jgi:hypothetical protein
MEETKTQVEVYQANEVAPPSGGDGLDTQIATAKQYPRDLKKFVANTTAMVCKNEATAASCLFALPRGGKTIEGRTIRFAEIVAINYGNLRIADRIVMEGEKEVIAEAIVFDMENNVAFKSEVPMGIVYGKGDHEGERYNEDMILMTKRAAQAKARRNAILTAVPPVMTEDIELAIDKMLLVEGAEFDKRVVDTMGYLKKAKVGESEVCQLLLIKKIGDMNAAHLRTLRGIATGIHKNEFTAETLLEGIKKKAGASAVSSAANRRREKQGEGQSDAQTTTPEKEE